MSTVSRPVHSFRLPLFFVVACLVGWAMFIVAALGARLSPSNLPIGPVVAALLVAAFMGRSELRDWGRQLITFRTSFGWYVLSFIAPVVIIIAAVLVNNAFGAPPPTSTQLAGWITLPAGFAFTLILVGIGEEAGWMAFAAQRLLGRYSFLTAWAILAGLRVLWHLPLMLTGELPWVLGIGGNIAFQFLLMWIFVRSHRVWFLAAIWHAVLNVTGGQFFFQMVQGEDRVRLGILMAVGYGVVAVLVLLVDYRRITQTAVNRGIEPIGGTR
ncbi:MAG: CPBP family intramembrane metalloprotease [Spirochaetales bacterium]|nr:CPBP family intramembrane metalloprotease [Spirochaetales bacterium]